MKGHIENLERLGYPMSLGLAVSLILIGLRKEFNGFVHNYNMHNMGKTVNELHAMLKLYEQTLPQNNALALHAIRAGHWKRNCPQYLAKLLKKKKNATSRAGGGSGIFVIELNTFLNRSWIYDTGCGTHICNTTQGLRASRKLKPGALSLYVGNGQREAVEAIGNFDLSLPSGLVIVLNNCHYAPSITRGVISVSRLYEDGFINRFVNNTIQVSRNNMIYFSDIPRDGIFEIDLCNSYANNSCMYAVSNKRAKLDLDSALLWHYHLGHISKKCIKKLQHDGFLNSTDLRAYEKIRLFGRLEDLEIIKKEDTHPSIDTSLHHKEDDIEIDEPQSDIIPIRRSTRIQNAPNRMYLYIDAEEHDLGDLSKPANYKAALLDPEYDKWLNAMNWLFKKKTDMDGAVHTYKARFVAKGYTQTPGIDYEETFSRIADIRAIRILIAIPAFYDYEI
ncbi:zinc finger, CCHC-type containing protein [Tanacetum coccineum]|uniref:Zinc finger, CCHC-type containing protein n=1 Tax=Tanacetum coccineum TaxID=301880 RepID=A0ABQ4ZFB5_9ASTR